MEDIEKNIDEVFPIKNIDGSPSYRAGQRDAIISVVKAFESGKKFVLLDGPVGCGKSVINYTAARVMVLKSESNSVYITPLKTLQDQIKKENWPSLKAIKGKSSYSCNHCGIDKKWYMCNYDGADFSTCNNDHKKMDFTHKTLFETLAKITEFQNYHSNDEYMLGIKSAFMINEHNDKIKDMMEFMATLLYGKNSYELSKLEDKDEDIIREVEEGLAKQISCVIEPVECPYKSAKFLAKMSAVRVLNPDIFYYFNLNPSSDYSHNELIVYDECHQIEEVISRIFRSSIPVDLIKNLFGIDFSIIYKESNPREKIKIARDFIEKLNPLIAACSIIVQLGDIMGVRNFPTMMACKSKGPVFDILERSANNKLFEMWRENKKEDFSMLDVLQSVFAGENSKMGFYEFEKFIRKEFISKVFKLPKDLDWEINVKKFEKGFSFRFDVNIISAFENFFGNSINSVVKKLMPKPSKSNIDAFGYESLFVSKDLAYARHMKLMSSTLKPFLKNFMYMDFNNTDDKLVFVLSSKRDKTTSVSEDLPVKRIVRDHSYLNLKDERIISITPLDVASLMNVLFYKKAKHILLSTATWVGIDGAMHTYGIPKEQAEIIKIPSTFPKKNRPTYLIDSMHFTNFSEKGFDGSYVYRSTSGINKVCTEVNAILSRVRIYINKNMKKNANIVIHCYTHNIAKLLAENLSNVNESFYVQVPDGSVIVNKSGYIFKSRTKDELVSIMKNNPDSGITLISPSVSEGIDFKYDVARAQIILKSPIPYLGDDYVKAKYKGDESIGIEKEIGYLNRMIFTEVCQQYGRVVRSEDDWGITIVMDQALVNTIKPLLVRGREGSIKSMNIGYFMESIMYSKTTGGLLKFDWPFD